MPSNLQPVWAGVCVRCVVSLNSGLHVRNKRDCRRETRQVAKRRAGWKLKGSEVQPDERSVSRWKSAPKRFFLSTRSIASQVSGDGYGRTD